MNEALAPAMNIGRIALSRPTGLFDEYGMTIHSHDPIVKNLRIRCFKN